MNHHTLAQLLEHCEVTLAQANVYNPAVECRRILAAVVGEATHEAHSLPPEQMLQINDILTRRARREPLARILGMAQFCGLTLRLAPGVFRPYPETETLVQLALEEITDRTSSCRILDLGCGSGAISLALLHALPLGLATGIDINPVAVSLASENAACLQMATRATFQVGNWTNGLNARFDLVVSYPPAVPTRDLHRLSREMREHDPVVALDGGRDGLDFYRRTAAALPDLLAPNGSALVQVTTALADDVTQLFNRRGLKADRLTNYLGLAVAVRARRAEECIS